VQPAGKKEISKIKIKQTKKGNFQQSWSVTMHQIALGEIPDTTCTSERASTSRCYKFLPPDLSLSISENKTDKLPALPVQPACKQFRTALKQIYKQP
jgi:hypothetical protein